jgi:hypothetical protein
MIAYGGTLSLKGTVDLSLQVGDRGHMVKQMLYVSDSLPVNIILGTSFIDAEVDAILPPSLCLCLNMAFLLL